MKKETYLISYHHKNLGTISKEVIGYTDYNFNGLSIGLHKDGYSWHVTELNTGMMFTSGYTRKEALNKAVNFVNKVKDLLNGDSLKPAIEFMNNEYHSLAFKNVYEHSSLLKHLIFKGVQNE